MSQPGRVVDPRDLLHRDEDPGDRWDGWRWSHEDDISIDEPFGWEPMHYVPPGEGR